MCEAWDAPPRHTHTHTHRHTDTQRHRVESNTRGFSSTLAGIFRARLGETDNLHGTRSPGVRCPSRVGCTRAASLAPLASKCPARNATQEEDASFCRCRTEIYILAKRHGLADLLEALRGCRACALQGPRPRDVVDGCADGRPAVYTGATKNASACTHGVSTRWACVCI